LRYSDYDGTLISYYTLYNITICQEEDILCTCKTQIQSGACGKRKPTLKRILSGIMPILLLLSTFPKNLSEVGSDSMNLFNDNPKVGERSTSEGLVTLYSASGEITRLPTPKGIRAMTSFTLNESTSIFFNDVRAGDKVDILLRNYTLLSQQEYIQNGKVRVIILLGKKLGRALYKIDSLGASEISFFYKKLQQFDSEILSTHKPFSFITAVLPCERVFELAEEDYVAHVFLDKKYSVQLAESVPLIKPPETWDEIELHFGFEINGSGVKVAVLDTGIDRNHPDLDDLDDNATTYDLKVIAEKCFTNENHTWDGYGHGTHCASIAAGTGEASNHTYVGVAPAAFLLNGKVLTDGGWGYNSWIISGIEWAVNESTNVISMSLGANINGDGTDPLSMALDWATNQGVTCVVAAGNSGGGGMFTVGTPAVSKEAITVGATTKADEIIYFSSQGPSSDYRLKPDVCAPGVDIVAARANGTGMGTQINDHYTGASGTSMSTPHVAGVAALILQARPDWNPSMIKSALMTNAKTLNERLWRQGAGRIDACAAVNATLLIVKPSSSFGTLSIGDVMNTTLTLMNVVDTPTSINLSTITFCDGNETNYVSINATSLTIPANNNATILLQVGPLDSSAPEGWLNITSVQGNVKSPYLFAAFSIITTYVYDIDDATRIRATMILTTYPNMTFVNFAETPRTDTRYGGVRFFTKSGDYAICAQMAWIDNGSWPYDFTRMFMLQKIVSVPKFSVTNVSISLADAKVSYIPIVNPSGNNLTVHQYTQYFCGGPQNWYGQYFQLSEWSIGSSWNGYDLNVSQLTFYSTNYTPPDRLCEALGYYASDSIFSEVLLIPLKYWNVSSLPDTLYCQQSDLAKYYVLYDMPETYPQNGLNNLNAFWFTWDHLGSFQGWGWDVHRVFAGVNATYYLAPGNGTYFGCYMPTYEGWYSYHKGPLEEWNIGRHYPYPQVPLEKGETGSAILGRFSFAPYQPGLNLNVSSLGAGFLVNLTGDIWSNLSWPHWQWIAWSPVYGPISTYPQRYAEYRVCVNGTLLDEGKLNGKKGYMGESYVQNPPYWLDVDWCGISETWNITGGNVLIQLTLPSMATISRHTVYNMSFTLSEDDTTPPIITGLSHLLNYTPGRDFQINFTMLDTGSGIKSHLLKYSFDNATTWQDATFQEPFYVIPCVEADSLAIFINITDNAGNSLQCFSSPIAVCSRTKIRVTEEVFAHARQVVEVSGNLTTIEGKGLENYAVRLSDGEIIHAVSDENGTFIFNLTVPYVTKTYTTTFPSAGVYASGNASFTIQVWKESSYLVVRGLDNRIYYRIYNSSNGSWDSWNVVPTGLTCESPSAALCCGKLHIVVRGFSATNTYSNYSLWHGWINLTDGSFSGWTMLSGATESAPTLVQYGSRLILIVRGLNNRIYYRFYDCTSDEWEGWTDLPGGATCNSPAATMLNDELHIVALGFSSTDGYGNYSLWHGRLNLTTGVFSGWTSLSGATASAPKLVASKTSNRTCLVIRGFSNQIYCNAWNCTSWLGLTALPSGATYDSPAATILDDELHVVVRGIDGNSLWHYYMDLTIGGHSGWMRISGATPSAPTLTK